VAEAYGSCSGVTLPQVPSPKLPFDPIEEARRQWEARWTPDAATEMVAVTSIMRVHQILMARLNELLEPFDLTFPRYEALMLLHFSRRGSLPLGKIGERLQVHRTSVTNLVDGLARSGFAERRPHDHDRRMMLAVITDAGRAVAEEATQALNEVRFATEPLTHRDLDSITDILRKLRADADGFSLTA
jgi:DNA-binding MarR family transcriptional regulator